MSTQPPEWDDTQLRSVTAAFPYPPTPPIAAAVAARLRGPQPAARMPRAARFAAIALLALLALLAVPPVRAAIVEILRIGAIRIIPTAPTAVPVPPSAVGAASSPAPPPTAVALPTPTPIGSVLDLAGETTLADAQQQVTFPIRLPSYPANLGPPDTVFVQDLGGPVVILVWLDPADPAKVRLSLHQFGLNTFAEKLAPRVVRETQVSGRPALWARGPHLLQTRATGQDYAQRRLVNGHVLIWTDGDITYRLETAVAEAEAIRIAESLR